MSASDVQFKVRPNKAVDRELFLSLLARLHAELELDHHSYVGLGGPFLEDFRLIHARTGISTMVCVEEIESVHTRQEFNKPISSVECLHSSLEDYLEGTEFTEPIVLWLDYMDPKSWLQQIDTFCEQVSTLPIRSVVRITLNANPASLGSPKPGTIATNLFGNSSQPTLQEWRLDRLRQRLPDWVPGDVLPDDLTHKLFGLALLRSLDLAVERCLEGVFDRELVWALATHYSDGQAMVTASAVIVEPEDPRMANIVEGWVFASTPLAPLVIDMPALSTRERLALECSANPGTALGYDLPSPTLSVAPIDSFSKFRRVYPQFARVDL